ncbi:hypothetical protein TNCV_2224381 [Trichonephila clavipes]|nr:hypothetical protein TNCV_2224381 [Trichonephila clavipes]
MSNDSWNAECAFCGHLETPLMPTFAAHAPASSILKGGSTIVLHYPAKLPEFPKSDFRFFPKKKKHQECTLHTGRILKFLFPTPRGNRRRHSALLSLQVQSLERGIKKLLGAVDTRRYPRAENRVWSDQEDHEERGSKDREASTCGPHSDSFNDMSRRRRSNCSKNNLQTPCRSKS